ncbi:integrator complex subunit 3 homolog isoform X2 [Mercenaria mercenaria]|uniref:integrator complex subunit 3 homolog isoform X2 n=1 Tax=Mercenaria mercenaria TaxID=6596 RepID=UPI001E1D26A9|nr:integrator complex subunit 3 homolog isoform X2 [Mercenaria mercenaria]
MKDTNTVYFSPDNELVLLTQHIKRVDATCLRDSDMRVYHIHTSLPQLMNTPQQPIQQQPIQHQPIQQQPIQQQPIQQQSIQQQQQPIQQQPIQQQSIQQQPIQQQPIQQQPIQQQQQQIVLTSPSSPPVVTIYDNGEEFEGGDEVFYAVPITLPQ